MALAGIAEGVGIRARPAASVDAAMAGIAAEASPPFRVLICGSLYLAGHVLAANG